MIYFNLKFKVRILIDNIKSDCFAKYISMCLFLKGITMDFLISVGQCSWILKILLVRVDFISLVTGLLHYYARKYSSLF